MRACLLLLCLTHVAWADDRSEADRLVAEGVALGEAGDYPGAIERFLAAERAFPRPVHDCNIGLAWIGLKAPATAYFFIDRCQHRATEPLPAWVGEQHTVLRTQMQSDGFATLTVRSTPPGAVVSFSTLKGAEPRTPVEVFVPRGPVAVTAWLDGFEPETRTITVNGPTATRFDLQRPRPAAPETAPPVAVAPATAAPAPAIEAASVPRVVVRRAPDNTAAWALAGAGVASALAGGYFLNAAFDEADAADRAKAAGDQTRLEDARDATRLNEGLAYGSFAVAVGLGVGAWLLHTADAPVALVPLGPGLGVRVRLP